MARPSSNIDLRIAESTQGWMAYKELQWLARQAKTHKRIVEIGSYLGRSTRALGDNTPGLVYAVDNYQGVKDMTLPPAIRDNVFELFVYNTGTLIEAGKVIPVVADHATVELDVYPDMVFIDGSHEYTDVKRDIELWLTKIAPGGLLCGHDIQFPQVKQAVSETVPKHRLARQTSIWYSVCD